MLTSDVALLADLPITRAIMTSPDPVTIQDASQDVWQHARSSSDLFVLVNRSGKVVALHTKTPGFTPDAAEKYFQQSLDDDRGESSHWWLRRASSLPDFCPAHLPRLAARKARCSGSW